VAEAIGEQPIRYADAEPMHLNVARVETLPELDQRVDRRLALDRIEVVITDFVVTPETLTVVGTETIGNSIYSIDYNPTTDRYVVGLSGGQSFCILDADFKVVSRVNDPTPRTKGYTTQGVTSDDRYIYFVLYHKSPNVITVYDWDGKFVTLIELDIGTIEPESIAIVRHEIYIFCGLSGEGRLYRIGDLTPKEQ
jgi:hypothetical protein